MGGGSWWRPVVCLEEGLLMKGGFLFKYARRLIAYNFLIQYWTLTKISPNNITEYSLV